MRQLSDSILSVLDNDNVAAAPATALRKQKKVLVSELKQFDWVMLR